jgi:hypothetical protein
MRRAVEGLGVVPQHLLIDAKRLKETAIPQQAIIKGDVKSASIAAASILAKVSRDALMRTLDTRHPGYGFADHKGHPVRAHYKALAELGACPAHRRSFGPVREVLGFATATALALGIGARRCHVRAQGIRRAGAGVWPFSFGKLLLRGRSGRGRAGRRGRCHFMPSRSASEAAAIAASNAASFMAYSFSALPSWRTRHVPSA